ncbi:DNA polymerase III subunit epsilon [Amphritea pacifica]|uniref:DNA polymerase III subunit epsilon n=1 Tax=Amphritea pacifica TaxID=2811233 RepID=A0ABS2W695_9GAMM|nr:DNA polymerase III subunit epsilon [Amphritea pacifica]MBN0987120.1 DNA polymerase III subunit epsilon [Amphritea pacifica]MBN1007874.1 DNA polymerase III subunit epsilon [Amphritea pacifica]
MRQIVLDTETTGIDPKEGHRIIEIGCVEMMNRRLTGRTYHRYLKPDRVIDDEAIQVHGITNEFLDDKPRFEEIQDEFLHFIRGADLVIHNAAFDVGFIDHELSLNNHQERVHDFCQVTDTLAIARKKHPGQKNNLDALCRRYGIDNSHRELHGALLDSEILADVYLMLTGGQKNLMLAGEEDGDDGVDQVRRLDTSAMTLKVVRAEGDELDAHRSYIERLDSKGGSVWSQLGEQSGETG